MPRWLSIGLALALGVAIVAGVPATRESILRAAGHALIAEDPLMPADIIVISLDAGGAGVLEAADLVQSGIAKRVAVFADPPSHWDHEFIRRGLPYEDEAARQVRQLGWLGVHDVERVPRGDAGTEGEAQVLPSWCDQNRFQSILVVSSADHSRRLRRVLDRAMQGHPTKVMLRPSRYSQFDPDRWWQTRGGLRTVIIESQKLVLDIVRHPW